jgi:integrase
MTRSDRSSAVPMASMVTSRDGFDFDPTARRWVLSRDVVLRLGWVDSLLAEPSQTGAVKTLLHFGRTYAAGTTSSMADHLHRFLSFASCNEGRLSQILPYMLINYRATLDRTTEWRLGALRGFLKHWVELGYAGVDPEVVPLLYSWRLKGGIKGLAVRTKCPHKGALSDFEHEALQQCLLDAYERNDIPLDDFVLVTLFMATGRRPCQLADLKGLDLIEARSSDGLREFVLKVPRRKQRCGGWRMEFKPVALTPEIGTAVRCLIQENAARLLALRPKLITAVQKELPLFPAWGALKQMVAEQSTSVSLLMKTEAFHVTTALLRARSKQAIARLSVPSERTGAPISVFPTRLRRTLATRAAREGYGPLVIAELLDHTDDQNARIYTENVPEHVDAINQAVARQLAPLAQAFAGVIVDLESDAVRGQDMTSRIRTEGGSGAGTCGHYGFCGACAPIACYTCRHFQPWLDGAHEEVLEVLSSERLRILEITRDPAIASINDRTIFAVTEVMQRCESRRAELKEARRLG